MTNKMDTAIFNANLNAEVMERPLCPQLEADNFFRSQVLGTRALYQPQGSNHSDKQSVVNRQKEVMSMHPKDRNFFGVVDWYKYIVGMHPDWFLHRSYDERQCRKRFNDVLLSYFKMLWMSDIKLRWFGDKVGWGLVANRTLVRRECINLPAFFTPIKGNPYNENPTDPFYQSCVEINKHEYVMTGPASFMNAGCDVHVTVAVNGQLWSELMMCKTTKEGQELTVWYGDQDLPCRYSFVYVLDRCIGFCVNCLECASGKRAVPLAR